MEELMKYAIAIWICLIITLWGWSFFLRKTGDGMAALRAFVCVFGALLTTQIRGFTWLTIGEISIIITGVMALADGLSGAETITRSKKIMQIVLVADCCVIICEIMFIGIAVTGGKMWPIIIIGVCIPLLILGKIFGKGKKVEALE